MHRLLNSLFYAGLAAAAVLDVYLSSSEAEARSVRDYAPVAASIDVPAAGRLEVAFSPNEGAEELVCKAINSARPNGQIRGLAYAFTNARIVGCLLEARKRGVDVQLIVDFKENISADRSGKARAALNALALAGASVFTIKVYPIHHDKSWVIDGITTELGSFNFSDAAAHTNSENVLVNWNNPALAAAYLKHFERNLRQAERYTPSF